MFSTTFAPPRVLSSRGFAKSSLPSRMLAKSRTEQPRSSAMCINLELWIPRLKVARDLKKTWLKFGLYTVQHATWHFKLFKCSISSLYCSATSLRPSPMAPYTELMVKLAT